MKIGQVVKEQQPDVHKKLNKKPRKKRRRGKESLSFSDFENMMKHNSYVRHRGSIKQR